jgi:hypothetical protein
MSNCELCGEPMPEGEEMFKFHGYSGPCPKENRREKLQAYYNDLLALQDQTDQVPLTMALDAVGLALELLPPQ